MSEFKVRVQELYGVMDSTQRLEGDIQQIASDVLAVKRNLRLQIRQRERIDSRLNAATRQLEGHRRSVGRAVGTGRDAVGFYERTEAELAGLKVQSDADGEKSRDKPFDFGDFFPIDILLELIGNVGLLGGSFKYLTSACQGNWVDLAQDGLELIGSGAELVDEGASIKWKDVLGLAKRTSAPRNLKEALADEFGKFKVGKSQSAGGNASAVAKWAGTALTVVETGIGNYDEYKDDGGWSNPEMYAEIASESAIKIGTGIAVASIVAMCTPVGWTVAAVGVATAVATIGVNWALDGVSKLITGNDKGWVENTSDAIIGGVKKVGDCAKKAGKSIAKWWNGLWN